MKESRYSIGRMLLNILGCYACFAGSNTGVALETMGESPTDIRASAGAILTLGGMGDFRRGVSSFVAAEGAKIILVGKRGARFEINVTGDFEMSGAVLTLEGGLLPTDVLFNLTNITPGVRRRIAGNSEFLGSILTVGAPVTISNAAINGRKISGPIERAMITPLKPPPRPRGPVGP